MASEKHPPCRVQSLLQAATTLEEAVKIVTEGIQNKLSSLLAIPVEDTSKSISSNGVDSLVATEFRTWLVKELGAESPYWTSQGLVPSRPSALKLLLSAN